MGDTDNKNTDSNVDTNVTTDTNDNSSSDNNTEVEQTVDTEAFAELISEKDKRIEQLEKDVKMLKKNNADLTVKISAQSKPDKTIEQVIVDFCDTRKVK